MDNKRRIASLAFEAVFSDKPSNLDYDISNDLLLWRSENYKILGGKMLHYFVNNHGMHIEEQDLVEGFYNKKQFPHMYTTRKGAVKAAMRELEIHIRDCMAQFKAYNRELL